MENSTILVLPLAFLLTTTINAQTWTVGIPVEETFSNLILYGNGCYPSQDGAFNFPSSLVTGVDHIAIVTAVDPSGSILVVPGPVDALELGDTIWITTTETRQIFYPAGYGVVSLEFKAVGTPEVVGQAYPCSGSDFWISDMGICPETLSQFLQTDCMTDGSTGVDEMAVERHWFIAPSEANGGRIELRDVISGSVQVLDLQGRLVGASITMMDHGGNVDMGAMPNGLYVVRAIGSNGAPLVQAFALVH